MTYSDDRPDPIEDMLAALREDDPVYTDAELDAGFTAVLTALEHLTPERAQEADDLAVKAELGSDAYALGLEYLERGDLERATHWLRIAASHGVPAARQKLQDARELHHTVDSLPPEIVRSHPLAEQLDCLSCHPAPDLSTPPVAASRLRELRSAERRLADARQEAERILADARRAAAQITADAQHAAQSEADVAATGLNTMHLWRQSTDFIPKHRLHSLLLLTLRDRDMDFMLVNKRSGRVAAIKNFSDSRMRWYGTQGLSIIDECSVGRATAVGRAQSHLRLAESWRGLHNLIGREAAEAYEQALEGNDPSCLRLLMIADPQLAPRLLDWAQTASPATAGTHRILVDILSPSASGLVLTGARDLAMPAPAGAPK
ncbi:hypothetical protein [Streptomyces sp. bgisy034]|uniref:hypothetical protein n=1 Tax=Streptomyces sp. bgisy034 TaxID=3413774 RepID=UPI003EC050FE